MSLAVHVHRAFGAHHQELWFVQKARKQSYQSQSLSLDTLPLQRPATGTVQMQAYDGYVALYS